MKRALMGFLLAVLALLASTALGLGLIHITGFPYTADIEYLEIQESSGLDRQEIMENYGAVMDYLSPFSREGFHLPTLKYTETGADHFRDCKVIFAWVYLLGLIAALGFAMLAVFRCFDRRTLRYSGIMTAAIPLLLALGALLNFDRLFIWFHRVFFQGETWIFDPNYDEIINILPQNFFMHCALFIAVFWLLAAVLQLFLSREKEQNVGSRV